MNDIVKVTVAEGKYTFRYESGKTLACDRYGEAWVDEFNTGSNAIVQLVHLADDQAQRIAKLEAVIKEASVMIEAVEPTYHLDLKCPLLVDLSKLLLIYEKAVQDE